MKVLVYTSPARGHLYPVTPVVDELVARGHAVAVRTLRSEVGLVESRGATAAAIDPAIEAIPHTDFEVSSPPAKLRRGFETFARRAALEVDDLRSAIVAEAPDLLLVDCMTWGAAAVAEGWGGPWAQWFPFPLPARDAAVPPFGPGFAPASGPLGRIRDRVLGPVLARTAAKAALPLLNPVRARVGVPALKTYDELVLAPPLLLYMTAEPFEYPRRAWPAAVKMIGPSAWDPPAEAPAWLAEVEQPIVLVTTSSEFQDDGRLVRTALEALADEDVFVVATMPSAARPESVPANARVEEFVPHSAVLGVAACAITHGGMGATQKALAAGVPVCVVPFGRDQNEVARRAVVAGAGTMVPAGRLRPDRLLGAVREAMALRGGAERVAAGYRAAGGAPGAADALEALAATRAVGASA